MAARRINHGKSSKPIDPQSRFPTPLRKKTDELPENVDNGASVSNFSEGCEKEEIRVILDVNSNKKSSVLTFQSGATNMSSPSKLSRISSVNHSKDKPVDYCGNHSIEGHPGQNYEMKDVSLTYDQQIEVKPHVSYNTHSMLHPHHHSNHSMDRSPNHHRNYSVRQLSSQEDTYSTKDVQGSSNEHNDLFYYKGTRKKKGFNRLDDNVWKEQSNGEELKLTSSHASVKLNQKTKEGCLHSPRNSWQQRKTRQTRKSPIFKWEETIAACNSQRKSSSGVESINAGLLMMPFNSHVNREDLIDESHQTSDGNMTTQCDKNNITEDRQLPKCEKKEKKQAAVVEIYICLICEKEFRQSGNFQNHMKSHTESLHYCKCGNCGSMFDSDGKLLQHMRKEHTGSNPYKCDECDRVFSQLNNLHRHKRAHRESTLTCPFCTRTFNEDQYLNQHLRSHTGLKTYTCGVCKTQFRSTKEFKDHVSKHDRAVVHTCNVCFKSFSKACVLRQHMKSHSGIRPFSCVQCHKAFVHRHHLNMHMRSHTESKSFTCETCGKEFSQTRQFKKHKREHLVEAKLSKSRHEDSNGCKEKAINTSIPDELNVEPRNLGQKPKVKPDQKKSRGPRKKVDSDASSAYLHHASQISKANPFQYDSSDPSMFVPLSNEPTQKVMKQMNFPLPGHPPHYNPMYMASAPDVMAGYFNNWYMMHCLSHSGQGLGNEYAVDLSLPKRNQSYESPRPLSLVRDSSPTVNPTKNAPISSPSMYQEHNQYFHNSTFARPVEFLNYNLPAPVNEPVDLSLPTTHRRSKYGSIGENDVEDLSSRGSLSSNSPNATSSDSLQPDTLPHHKSGPIDHLKSASTSIMKPRRDQSKLDMQKMKNNESRCDKPVGISSQTNSLPDDCTSQNKGKRLKNETHYSTDMKFKKRKGMLNSQDLSRGTILEDRKLENCRKLKAKGEKVGELKGEAYAEEEKQVEDNASQPEEISCLKQQIKAVREMIQHEIQKETIDIMTDIEEEEEEGRLIIVEEDTEIQHTTAEHQM